MKLNVGLGGGSCTGKSVLAGILVGRLKVEGLDYDLVTEESRKLEGEFGQYRSPFERFYMWRQQEREELRSSAVDGFVTDTPLIQLYASARLYANEPRDALAVRELLRMCFEVKDRYQILALAEDPSEFPYKNDSVRRAGKKTSLERHRLVRTFVEHFWPEKLMLVRGSADQRAEQIMARLSEMRAANS